jgi:membrane protein YdbS with pleckstrin-like domain
MEFKRPDPRVRLCWTAYTVAAGIALAGISAVLFQLSILPPWMPRMFTIVWSTASVLIVTVYHPMRYRRMRYAINSEAIAITSGCLFTTYRRMPLSAVRHITAVRGPLERLTGITTLLISATGGRIFIEGIPVAEADRLTRALTE